MPTDPSESKKKNPATSPEGPPTTYGEARAPATTPQPNDAAMAWQNTCSGVATAIGALTKVISDRLPVTASGTSEPAVQSSADSLHENLLLNPDAVRVVPTPPVSNAFTTHNVPRS